MEKTAIAINLGGISNRVKCLISMWRLADLYGRELILYWPKNYACGCKFRDLFENEIKEINESQLVKIKKKDMQFFGDGFLTIKNSPKKYLITGTSRLLLTPRELEENEHLKKMYTLNGKRVDSNFFNIPEKIKKDILKYLVRLRPTKSLQKELDSFEKKYNLKEMVGVHIRRGDFYDRPTSAGRVSPNEKFIEKMKELVKEKPRTKFFLCTDSREGEEIIEKEFPGRVFKYPKTSFVRADVRAIQEGLIDLLLLSKTKHIIGTYKSTFTEMAWWFGECKPKIEIIVDPEKEREHFENIRKSRREIIPKIKRVILKLMGRKFI